MKKALVLFYFLCASSLSAQISGIVQTTDDSAMGYVNVLLLNQSDSSLVEGTLTDLQGKFALKVPQAGNYFIRFTFVGFQDLYSPTLSISPEKSALELGTVTISEEVRSLDEVVVSAQKAMVEQIPEGKVLNVQSSILTKGSNALQVLERSPGVVLDRRNNVLTLNGQQGTLIMINGRTVRMSQADLINMLTGMSADNIESIELLTNPSARYDADGGAGIINIKLIRNRDAGTQGSFSGSLGYGWSDKEAFSANLNTQIGQLRLYTSYAFNRDHTVSNWHAIGSALNPFFGPSQFDFSSETENDQHSHNLNLGFEKDLNQRWTLGGGLMYNPSKQVMQTKNLGFFNYEQSDDFNQKISIDQEINIDNLNTSLYAERNGKGTSLGLSLDYLNYKNSRPSRISSTFSDPDGNELVIDNPQYANVNRGESETGIDIGIVQVDYKKTVNEKLSIEAGLKNSYSFTQNQALVLRLDEGEWLSNEANTSQQDITENIVAGYFSASITLDSLTSINAGLRYENWFRDYGDPELDGSFGQLFPSLFITRKLRKQNSLQLAFNRRVTRPTYNDLASFVVYNNPTSVFTGNPLLRPTITDNFRLGLQQGSVNFDLVYTNEQDPIVGFQQVEREDGLLVAITPQNMDYQRSYLLQTNIPLDLADGWTLSFGGSVGLREFKILHTREQVEKRYTAFNLYGNTNIRLPWNIDMELSGFFNGDSYYGTLDAAESGMLNAGFRKELKNDLGTIQLSITDVFQTMRYKNTVGELTREAFDSFAVVNFYPESGRSRIFRITYSRSFGNSNGKARRDRASKALEEKSRIIQNQD